MNTYDHLHDLLGAIRQAAGDGDLDTIIAACSVAQERLRAEEAKSAPCRVEPRRKVKEPPTTDLVESEPARRLSPSGTGYWLIGEPAVENVADVLRFLLAIRARLRHLARREIEVSLN